MPALITHSLFAEETLPYLPHELFSNGEEQRAYILGSQGPDPFFCRWTGPVTHNHTCHVLADQMHAEKVAAALESLRAAVLALPKEDQGIGRAFTVGLFAHYWLDSHAHPFVYAEQEALGAQDPDLVSAHSEVHAVIEADIDSWLLWARKEEGAETGEAAQRALETTPQISRIGSALFSQTAHEVYGLPLDGKQYGHAVRDYARLYHALEPKGRLSEITLTNVEELAREYSMLASLVHPAHHDTSCASANTEHHVWKDPATGKESTESFLDVFEAAEKSWPEAAEAFLAGKDLFPLTGNRNYNGDFMSEGEGAPDIVR